MDEYIKTSLGHFDSEEVRILSAALDKAWRSVVASGAAFETDTEAKSARLMLANYIIEAASLGELDQRRLCAGAVVHLAQASLRNPPRVALVHKSKWSSQST
jgi:hypothetical protein